jgi:hypothetical protein
MKGITVVGSPTPPASPQAATSPSYLVCASIVAKVLAPTLSTPAAQRSFSIGLPSRARSSRGTISVAPMLFR